MNILASRLIFQDMHFATSAIELQNPAGDALHLPEFGDFPITA
jgi:hypothetical protein